MIRQLDHVGVVVRNTEAALTHFRDRLGLPVVAVDDPPELRVHLTYLDMGSTFLQLVEPLDDASLIAQWMAQHGEGLHHICFRVDHLLETLEDWRPDGAMQAPLSSGRGHPAGFVAGEPLHGVRIECTEIQSASIIGDGSR
jgi:methylmalonyl-CoA/ethylmalonyl-CoA epimerase